MAGAQVLMGLMPTILATLGPSTEETSTLSVIGKRPYLALFPAAGSPAAAQMRSFDVKDPLAILKNREDRLPPPQPPGKGASAFVPIFKYLMAIAAIGNVATMGQELGSYLVIIIHISGAITLRLRIKIESQSSFYDRLAKEFTPIHQRELHEPKQEGYWITIFSWITAFLSVCYVIYGTLTLSSITFISVRDSIMVIARYIASVIWCWMILMYELACLRDKYIRGGTYSSTELESLSNAPKPGNQFRT